MPPIRTNLGSRIETPKPEPFPRRLRNQMLGLLRERSRQTRGRWSRGGSSAHAQLREDRAASGRKGKAEPRRLGGPYPVRPQVPSSPASHHSTGASEPRQGAPTPPERSTRQCPQRSPSPAMMKTIISQLDQRMVEKRTKNSAQMSPYRPRSFTLHHTTSVVGSL